MARIDGRIPRSVRRSLDRPGILGAVLVLLTLLLCATLGVQAVRAAASHRAAVEAALVHHATTAAWRFSREARSWIGYGMNEARGAIQSEAGRLAVLPGPDVLKRVLAEKYCDCMTAAFGRTFARVMPTPNSPLDLIGEPLSLRASDALRDSLLVIAADTIPRPGKPAWRILAPGVPRLNRPTDAVLAWRINARGKRAVYAMIVEQSQIERPLIGALENAQFFPPSLVSPAAAESLVRIVVVGPNGATLFSRGPDTARFSGSDTLGVDYGRMRAIATVNPAAAQALVAGGIPSSRVPMIVALLVIALVMGGAAVMLIRREHRVARLREDFVSGVSHELRTPLTQIRMLSELLETNGFRSPAEQSRAVSIIHRESLRLTNLVDNILEFSRLRRSPSPVPMNRVSLAEVVQEVAETLGPLVEAQGSRLEVVTDDDVHIRGDRDAVSRVFRNLLENAAKYGTATQTIRMTLSRVDPNAARITVDDEGPGIPPEERSRIWQPYYRLDRDRNAAGGGSGLGLSVVADLVRLLGGSVMVGDAPGRGTRFTVELPEAT